ncbi:nucleic-acid-binding protein from transposon X-element [Trichonephila clavipes]|nr:nucleic-acid-binding protein from transposon X-element [Trichonephila clavipes]
MTNRKTGLPMPLFLVTLPRNEDNKNIFNLTELCYRKIIVEPLRPKFGPTQCFRCQGFFHIEILFKEHQVCEVRKAPPHQGDQGDTPEILDEILTTARDLELEVNEDDIEELIMGHEDELTTEELQEILNEEHQETHRNVSPEQEEDEREPMPTSAIKDLLKKWADARAMVLEWHPNQADARSPERINRFHIEVYAYHAIRKYVETEKLEAFTYQLPEDREIKAVIRGMPADTTPQEIIEDLLTVGIKVNECHAMTNRKTGLPRPLFLLTLPKNNINKDVFNMTELCYLRIKVEPLRPKIGPAQSFRCQGFFHSSKYCTRNPKCGQPHLTRSCTKTSATEATCCNCQGNHPANYTGCPKNPLNKPPPPPKVNFWEEQARKRREMQEAAKAQADAARLIATSAPAYTPHHAAPASVPTPPPVNAASVPRPRPAPTPSTSQTSTPAINSTSNPPSTIAETLKQLREPKVVEIFQVLKQVIAICNSDMPLADRAIEVAALLQIDLPI